MTFGLSKCYLHKIPSITCMYFSQSFYLILRPLKWLLGRLYEDTMDCHLLRVISELEYCQNQETWVLHMCFARFLLAFESRDLSQADKSIIRVSFFPQTE